MKVKQLGTGFTLLVLISMLLSLMSPAAVTAAVPAQEPSPTVEALVTEEITLNGETDFFVWMTEKADLSPAYALKTKAEKGAFVFETLKATAERTQKDLRAYLDAQGVEYQAFYIANKILVRGGNLAVLNSITARADVAKVTANHQFQLQEPFKNRTASNAPSGIESNISFINADDAWALGIDGAGLIVAGNDTGLQWDHPALINHYRGWDGATANHNFNWWDATDTYPMVPGDGHGHGTHTGGTMVGDDGGANQIGVAPGAQIIHCKNMTDGGSGDDGTFSECFEWDLAPWDLTGSNADPALAPDAVNNSWGYWGGNQPQFADEINALQAAGIVVEVSAGNEGPTCTTLRSPSDYENVITTGSIQHTAAFPGTITGFSSRGPSLLDPAGYFPDIMAPGENIRSSVPGGGYEGGWSGTSMSGPHTTALIALMWQAGPALRGDIDTTYQIIKDTAVPLTGQNGSNCGGDYTDGPNNDWGVGTIDALAAVNAAMAYAGGVLEGTVTDATTSAPIEDAKVEATDGANTYFGFTDAAGEYLMHLPAGTFDVTFSAWAYLPETEEDIVITEDMTTTLDAELSPADVAIVSGVVEDALTGRPLYAALTIPGYPGGVIWTDPVTGYYEVELPEGVDYEITAAAWVEGYLPLTQNTGALSGDLTLDFAMNVDIGSCTAPGYEPVETIVDDFESGYSLWTMDGLWNAEADTDTCGAMVAPFPSPSNAAYYGDDSTCDYNTGTNSGSLTLADPFSIPAGGGALFVSSYEETECGGNCGYDENFVEISTDGSDWTTLGEGNTEGEWYRLSYDLLPYAGDDVWFRFRFDSGDEISNTYFGWMVDNVSVRTGCEPIPGGFITGNVYDENTGDALNGAMVAVDMGDMVYTYPTPDDPAVDDGFYTVFAAPGDQDVTASYDDYADVTETVAVVEDGAVDQDFYLPAGQLMVTPGSLEVNLALGYTTTQELTLENTGGADLTFEIKEKPGGFMAEPVSIPPAAPVVDTAPQSIGRAPNAPQISSGEMAAWLNGVLAGEPAYAIDIYPGENLVYIPDTTAPGTWDIIGSVSGHSYFGGDFLNGDFSTMYVVDYVTNNLYAVDTATGASTLIGPAAPGGGESWTGLSGAPDGTLYGSATTCSSSTIYTVDPETGATTPIGSVSAAGCLIDIAINADGEMFGVDIINDNLVWIDPATGDSGVVGSLGVGANYAQGMDFEEETGILYWAAYTASGELRIIDTTTGASTLVGAFPGGVEVDCLAFATGGGAQDVPWLSEEPITGTIPAGETVVVDVTFDASVVTENGTYTATLRIETDTPYERIDVPVTMIVGDPFQGVEITPEAALSGHPGETVIYELEVSNTGNMDDVYDIEVSGVDTDWVVVAPTEVAVGASGTEVILVEVTIPAGLDTPPDEITVTVTSQSDDTVTDTATLTTSVTVFHLYMPIVNKDLGE